MSNELKVALAVLFSIAAIYGGIRFLSGQPLFGGGYEVVAQFGDAQGLAPGSIVRLNGVRIGDVSDVSLSHNARLVFVHMAIDPGIEIPRGSIVQTSGLSALGAVNIEITPPAGAEAGKPLVPGDTLVANEVPDLFDLLAGQSNSLTARADTALSGAASTFTSSTASSRTRATTSRLSSRSSASSRRPPRRSSSSSARRSRARSARSRAPPTTSTRPRRMSATTSAASRARSATTCSRRAGRSARVAETNADSIAIVVNGLNTSLRRLDQNLATLNSLTANLDSTITGVREADGTVGLLIRDPSLYQNANAAAASSSRSCRTSRTTRSATSATSTP